VTGTQTARNTIAPARNTGMPTASKPSSSQPHTPTHRSKTSKVTTVSQDQKTTSGYPLDKLLLRWCPVDLDGWVV
jgi:hypothetical protein